MFGDTLVPIDGSRSSRRAIRIAAEISRVLGGKLDVVCFNRGPLSRDFRRQVHGLVQDEGSSVPLHVEVALQHAPAEKLITSYIGEHPAHLVCMAAHGRSRAPALLGTVTEAVIRSSHRPVLLVGPSVTTTDYDPSDPVLVAAEHDDATTVGHGWSEVFGSAVASVTMSDAVAHAESRHAAVIVAELGEQHRLDRLLHGSELADVIHDARCPVIVVATAPVSGTPVSEGASE